MPLVAKAQLPPEVDEEDFKGVVEKSPFTRSLNLPNSMILSGFAEMDGNRIAVLLDGETGDSVVVSESENEMGWKLVAVTGEENQLDAKVATISIGDGQHFRVAYDRKVHSAVMKIRAAAMKKAEPKPKSGGDEKKPSQPPSDEAKKKYYEAMKKKWESMTPAQQDSARRFMEERRRANPNMTPQERGRLYNEAMEAAQRQ